MTTATAVEEAPVATPPESKWPYHFEVVDTSRLIVDTDYQRELTSLAQEIGDNFDPAMVGTIIGSERRNGKIAVVDGQTRLRGADLAGVLELPALIYEGMTKADEAALFARLQRKRRNIATYQRFRAALVAKDPEALGIQKVLANHGLAVGAKRGGGGNEVQAVAALEMVYRKDPDLLNRVLGILTRAWGTLNAQDVFGSEIIRGIAKLVSANTIDDDRLVQRLKDTSPSRLAIRASMLREGRGGGGGSNSVYMADALLTEYARRS